MSSIPTGGSTNGAYQAQLDSINAEKQENLVKEAKRTADQELATAMAARIKSIRFA